MKLIVLGIIFIIVMAFVGKNDCDHEAEQARKTRKRKQDEQEREIRRNNQGKNQNNDI